MYTSRHSNQSSSSSNSSSNAILLVIGIDTRTINVTLTYQ